MHFCLVIIPVSGLFDPPLPPPPPLLHVNMQLVKPWPLKASCIITTLGYVRPGSRPEMLL